MGGEGRSEGASQQGSSNEQRNRTPLDSCLTPGEGLRAERRQEPITGSHATHTHTHTSGFTQAPGILVTVSHTHTHTHPLL